MGHEESVTQSVHTPFSRNVNIFIDTGIAREVVLSVIAIHDFIRLQFTVCTLNFMVFMV